MHPSDRVRRERGLRGAVLSGDERAWRAWYEEHFADLYGYVLWRCAGLRDLADEVVQETWLTAVRRIRAFDPAQGAFGGWLRGIATHLLRNHFRKEARRATRSQPLDDLDAPAAPGDAAPDRRERAERVARALVALPQRYEAVLRAKYLDGHSVAEIAAASGETLKAVESLLTRARQAFREVYLEPE
jgi:RNA polymerase sigma-70 factor (ECF subfamily)